MTTRLAFAVLALAGTISLAWARDDGQWPDGDVKRWYQGLRQPDNPSVSCCGESDAYWADSFEVKDGKVYAIVTDDRPDDPLGRRHIPVGTRIEVPPNKIKSDQGNPTGHFVIFIGGSGVYCYVTGTLT